MERVLHLSGRGCLAFQSRLALCQNPEGPGPAATLKLSPHGPFPTWVYQIPPPPHRGSRSPLRMRLRPPRPFPRSMRQNPAYFPLPPFLAGHTWSPIPNSAISFLPGPCATSSAGFLPKVTPQAASASHQDGSPNDSFTWLVSTPLLSPQRFLVRGPTGVGP